MKPDASDKDLAFAVMAMDILSNVLSRADNPGDLGTYLTDEVRELTGARCVLLIQCLCTPTVSAHRVVSVNPLRRREWAESPAGNRLYEVIHSVQAAQLWRGEEPSEVAGLLRREGFELSMVFPLHAGEFRVGAMLLLGLPDEEHATSVLNLLNNLSSIVALVLRNAILYEKQEQLIQERTAKLRDNNEKLAMELTERKRAEEALRDAYEYIQHLISSANVMIVGLDAAGRVRIFNHAAEKITGYTIEELTDINWFEKIVPRDRYAYVWETFRNYQQKTGAMPTTFENPILTKSGEERFISWQNSTISTPGSEISTISFGIDITERKRAETELARVNRALRMLSDSNQSLLHITEEDTLLNDICRIVVEVGGYRMAWVGYAEHDEAKSLRPVAHSGFDSGYIESARVSWGDNERGRGPGGIAIRTGQPCIVRNIQGDPIFAPWREEAIRRGYQSIIALPLTCEGQTLGALGVYACEEDAFDAREVEILKELVDDLAFGIAALRTKAKRDQAEEALRESENRYRRIIEGLTDYQYSVRLENGRAVETTQSPACAAVTGYTPEEFAADPYLWFCMVAPEDRELVRERVQQILAGMDVPPLEHRILRKDGALRWVCDTNILLKDASGRLLSYDGVIKDITERKRAEEELKFQNILLVTEQESSVDGILVVDAQGKIINFNKRFVAMWDIPEPVMDTHSDELALRHVLDKLVDPEEFLARVEYLYGHKEEISSEEILFKDGRVIDRYSAPMIGADGKNFGRVWYFRDITDQKNMINQLHKSIVEKEILLKELYHRTKNNMQVICSMLNLKIDQINDASVKGICGEIITKIQTMALVHQKLYESSDLANINVREYVTSIAGIIVKNNVLVQGKISIHQSVDSISISIDTAMPFGLVLNELITNSIKHAFPGDRKGDIRIEVHGHGDEITVEYSDNGTGLPHGFDPESTPTLGMNIIQTIVRMQLGGDIKISSDKGFKCQIRIKTNLYRTRI